MARSLALVLLACMLAACTSAKSNPLPPYTDTSTPITSGEATGAPDSLLVDDGTGAITGLILGQPENWQDDTITVYACPFYTTGGTTEGFYILEPTVHPRGSVSSAGEFGILSVPPGKYAIVVGPSPEDSVPVTEDGHVRVVEVAAGQVLDLGALDLR